MTRDPNVPITYWYSIIEHVKQDSHGSYIHGFVNKTIKTSGLWDIIGFVKQVEEDSGCSLVGIVYLSIYNVCNAKTLYLQNNVSANQCSFTYCLLS